MGPCSAPREATTPGAWPIPNPLRQGGNFIYHCQRLSSSPCAWRCDGSLDNGIWIPRGSLLSRSTTFTPGVVVLSCFGVSGEACIFPTVGDAFGHRNTLSPSAARRSPAPGVGTFCSWCSMVAIIRCHVKHFHSCVWDSDPPSAWRGGETDELWVAVWLLLPEELLLPLRLLLHKKEAWNPAAWRWVPLAPLSRHLMSEWTLPPQTAWQWGLMLAFCFAHSQLHLC